VFLELQTRISFSDGIHSPKMDPLQLVLGTGLVSRRCPPPKRRAAAAAAWRSVIYSLGASAAGRPDAPSHVKSLPNLISGIDVEPTSGSAADLHRKGAAPGRPSRRKGTPSGSRRRRRDQCRRRDDSSVAGSAANEGLVTSDEESMLTSSSDEGDDADRRSCEELVLVTEQH